MLMTMMGAVCICPGEWWSVRCRRIVSMRSHHGGLNTVTADSPPRQQFSHLSKHYWPNVAPLCVIYNLLLPNKKCYVYYKLIYDVYVQCKNDLNYFAPRATDSLRVYMSNY